MSLDNTRMKHITIATDVSCDDRYGLSVWACYIEHEGGIIKKTGQFKEFYKNTALAETYALINALTIAKNNIPDWKNGKVTIYNEIQYALDPIKTKAGNIRKRDAERSEAIRTIAIPILKEALDWECLKIKAHYHKWQTSENPARYIMNRWCDTNSRELLRRVREEKMIK